MFEGIASSLDDNDGEAPADQAGGGDKEGETQLYKLSPIKYFLEVFWEGRGEESGEREEAWGRGRRRKWEEGEMEGGGR